jgi:hypothetical protein
MNRTEGGLVLFPGNGNGHRSASERRIALAEAAANHFKSVIAVLVVQMGGDAVVPPGALLREYQMTVGQDATGAIVYHVAPVPLPGETQPIVETPPPPEPEKEPS